MKAFLLFFLVLMIGFNSLSQSDLNQFDVNNERHGQWKKYFPGTTQLRYEGTFEHGKEVGTFKFYCEDCKSQPMVVKEFSSKDNTAEVKYYTVKGKLVSEGKMDGKKRIGEWVYYHEKSHVVMTRENYVNDKLHGKKLTYYPNGKVTEEINYTDGVMQGDNLYYAPDGALLKKLKYVDNELHGEAFYYDAYGNVTIKGFYRNGKKHGLWQYFKDGKVTLEETFPKPKPNSN